MSDWIDASRQADQRMAERGVPLADFEDHEGVLPHERKAREEEGDMFDAWEAEGERHYVIGRLHGVSPGKYGPRDVRWYFDLGPGGLLVPTACELTGLAIGAARAQQDVFAEPPESVLSIYGYLEESRKTETHRELVRQMQVFDMHWREKRAERRRVAEDAEAWRLAGGGPAFAEERDDASSW